MSFYVKCVLCLHLAGCLSPTSSVEGKRCRFVFWMDGHEEMPEGTLSTADKFSHSFSAALGGFLAKSVLNARKIFSESYFI